MGRRKGFNIKQADKYWKAYLNEVDGQSLVKVVFSSTPFTPEQFLSLTMGVIEAYAQELLANNTKEQVYDTFNHAFGIFLNKLLPEEEIYERDAKHKKAKEDIDNILLQPEDKKDTEDNRMAAYLLASDILTNDIGLTEDAANLLLNKRLGWLKVAMKAIPDSNEEQKDVVEEDKGSNRA